MSLKGYWSDLLGQQPLGTSDAEQAASDNADAKLKASNADLVARGVWTQDQADAADADIAAGNNSTGLNDVAGSITGTFNAAVGDEINTGLNALKNPFPTIPTAWYVIAGLALFFWMGGLDWIKGSLKKKRT